MRLHPFLKLRPLHRGAPFHVLVLAMGRVKPTAKEDQTFALQGCIKSAAQQILNDPLDVAQCLPGDEWRR